MINGTPVKYKTYKEEKTVIMKTIRFDKPVAEDINKTIAMFNANEKVIKLNNDLLVNLAVQQFLNDYDLSTIRGLLVDEVK